MKVFPRLAPQGGSATFSSIHVTGTSALDGGVTMGSFLTVAGLVTLSALSAGPMYVNAAHEVVTYIATVATDAALTAINANNLPDGAEAWDTVFLTKWRLQTNALLAATPNLVAASSVLGRFWVRDLTYKDQAWMTRTQWYVDPAAGNDRNSGATAIAALKSESEVYRRVRPVNASVVTTLTITTLSDNSAEAVVGTIEFTGASALAAVVKRIGTPTVAVSGTLTAITAPVTTYAGAARGTVQSGAVADWTPYVGKIIEMTSGAAVGCWAVVMLNSAGVGQIGWFYKPNNAAGTPSQQMASVTQVTPAVNDSFNILTLTPSGAVDVRVVNGSVYDQYFDHSTGAPSVQLEATTGNGYTFLCCQLGGGVGGTPSKAGRVFACAGLPGNSAYGHGLCPMTVGGGAIVTTGGTTSMLFAAGDVAWFGTMSQGVRIIYGSSSGTAVNRATGFVTSPGFGIFDTPANQALAVGYGGRFGGQTTGPMFGTGNVGGINVTRGGVLTYSAALAIKASGTELIVEGISGGVAIPPPTGSPAAFPASSALATYANLTAAPFSASYFNFRSGNGTQIIFN